MFVLTRLFNVHQLSLWRWNFWVHSRPSKGRNWVWAATPPPVIPPCRSAGGWATRSSTGLLSEWKRWDTEPRWKEIMQTMSLNGPLCWSSLKGITTKVRLLFIFYDIKEKRRWRAKSLSFGQVCLYEPTKNFQDAFHWLIDSSTWNKTSCEPSPRKKMRLWPWAISQ